MPYIAIKAWPNDDPEKKAKLVEALNKSLLDVWGCPPHAVTISFEEVAKEDWEEKVVKAEIEPKADKIWIRQGEKKYL